MSLPCPFCEPNITAPILWENEYYRISPDEYPRCTGHLLVISKAHQHKHMSVPLARLPILEHAKHQAYRFLSDVFGKASFLENGENYQEILHAHLHCLPIAPSITKTSILHQIKSLDEVWFEYEKVGNYCYLETATGRFIVSQNSEYVTLLAEIRTQITKQTNAQVDRSTGGLLRGRPQMVKETVQLWKEWCQKTETDFG